MNNLQFQLINRILSIVNNNYELENEIYSSVKPLIFKNSIELKNINFNYSNAKKNNKVIKMIIIVSEIIDVIFFILFNLLTKHYCLIFFFQYIHK